MGTNYTNRLFWFSDISIHVMISPKIYFFHAITSNQSSNAISEVHLILSLQSVTPHGFRFGMKLEAVDKKNTVLTCVATVADVLGERILIHFDGWEDSYDYWCDPSSPYIHPVGWCQENGRPLSPPNGQFNSVFYFLCSNVIYYNMHVITRCLMG